MNILILDVECTTSNHGNQFDTTNKLVCVGIKPLTGVSRIYYSDFRNVQKFINDVDLIVGFNIKFDLHWLRKIGIDFSNKKIWDCQLAEFILNYQQTPYPSLDGAAMKYGFHKKLDVVKEQYWNQGIDTDQIPKEILDEYLTQDLSLTEQLFEKQRELFKTDPRYNLFRLQCMDLLVLEEMEYNGIYFDSVAAKTRAETLSRDLENINQELSGYIGNIPFNLNSNNHVSVILYGGDIVVTDRIPVGTYQTGAKVGHTRYKCLDRTYTLPRLVEPLPKTETKVKEGEQARYWKVNDDVLRSLKLDKHSRKIVELIQKYSGIEKLRGTYLIGWSELIKKMNWPQDMIHGTLNQCTVVTGRLSSTRPNLQNADLETKRYCRSRYDS